MATKKDKEAEATESEKVEETEKKSESTDALTGSGARQVLVQANVSIYDMRAGDQRYITDSPELQADLRGGFLKEIEASADHQPANAGTNQF